MDKVIKSLENDIEYINSLTLELSFQLSNKEYTSDKEKDEIVTRRQNLCDDIDNLEKAIKILKSHNKDAQRVKPKEEIIEVLVNSCYGGFGFSEELYKEMNWEWDSYGFGPDDIRGDLRTNPEVIKACKKIGLEEASGINAYLRIAKVPADVDWYIDEYDGIETVLEGGRRW